MSMTRYVFIASANKGKVDSGKAVMSSRITEHRELVRKSGTAIKSFLGTSRITSKAVIFPAYYGDLLTWALKRYMEREHWQTAGVLGYHCSEPVYANVSTDYHKVENLLVNGQLLIDSGDRRLVITVDARGYPEARVTVGGSADNKLEVKNVADGIKTISEKENYYRNKKIEFDGRIRFVNLCDKSWENLCLEPAVKAQIKASTIDSLGQGRPWTRHGLPLKRCVLLTGGEDKDKKAICRALMTEAVGITCIIADALDLEHDCAAQLYHLARDLSPCIVFLMNIDRFSQSRIKPRCQQGASLISLLTILGSVEEYGKIVTVATANCKNTISEAMFY
jgi:cell division protease FtsH